jgi:hypothetical protein
MLSQVSGQAVGTVEDPDCRVLCAGRRPDVLTRAYCLPNSGKC